MIEPPCFHLTGKGFLRGGPARLLGEIIDLLFPGSCLFCGAPLSGEACACSHCLREIPLFTGPRCARCGAPLDGTPPGWSRGAGVGFPAGEPGVSLEAGCLQCAKVCWSFARNVSLSAYDGPLRVLVHQLKFESRRGVCRLLGELAVSRSAEYIGAHQLLVPVPLTGTRKLERGYNQALLLGRDICRRMGAHGPVLCDALRRAGKSPPQSSLDSLRERARNMRDRFTLRRGAGRQVMGRRVLLVDDVLTSGATASACARALLEGGADRVDLFTAARTLRFSTTRNGRHAPEGLAPV
mgnify:CR=1 FL=1